MKLRWILYTILLFLPMVIIMVGAGLGWQWYIFVPICAVMVWVTCGLMFTEPRKDSTHQKQKP